jgi:acetyltransferase-like isoleucine patch superfamily enzyme
MGNMTKIYRLLRLENPQNIFIGKNVTVAKFSWLAATPLTNFDCKLIIGDGTAIGHFNHIYATRKIEIGNNVLLADKVYISDNQHSYEDITIPVREQPIKQTANVKIGDGSWLGENVCVMGASIGKHTVIGANSVVTKDIPDYCIAVGSPAKIIKKYSFEKNGWFKTDDSGAFLPGILS